MSEFRFFAFTDFEYHTNRSQNLLNLPISPFQPTKRTTTDDISHELNVPYTVFEILVAVFAIIGNLMVIIVFQRERKLRRRTNYYIVSLAIADFLVGLLGVPFAVLASIGLPTNLYACLFTVSLLVVLCTISIFCLVAVSVDRYWAILYPMAYSRNVRTRTAIVIISLCWVAGTVVGFLPLFGWHADVGSSQACLFVEVMDYDYLVFLYFATIITPALLMLAFYAHIYRVIIRQVRQIVTMNPVSDCSRRSSTAQIQMSAPSRPCHGRTMLRVLGAARKRDVKATQNLSIIVLFFMICWIPLYTINCIKAFCQECYVHPKLTLFCIILSHLNSAVNPVLYAYHLKDFRAALKNLILKVMGIEIEQPIDGMHRLSLASQHRLQSMDGNMRGSSHPKMYIDSPIWLRQQQQDALKNAPLTPKCGIVSSCLNNIHHTMPGVDSITTNIERDMWNIVEASSGAELGELTNKYQDEKNHRTPSPPPRRKRSSIQKSDRCDSSYTYDNQNYSTSQDEADFDEVFLPFKNNSSNEHQLLDNSFIAFTMHQKLRTDEEDYENERLANQRALTDSSYSDLEIAIQSTKNSLIRLNSGISNSTVYVIEKNHELSPGRKPKFKKSQRPSSTVTPNTSKQKKSLNRSCSCASDPSVFAKEVPRTSAVQTTSNSITALNTAYNSNSERALYEYKHKPSLVKNLHSYTFHAVNYRSQEHQGDKSHYQDNTFVPIKAVSNIILPPIVRHASLFQLFHPATLNNTESSAIAPTSIFNPQNIKKDTNKTVSTDILKLSHL